MKKTMKQWLALVSAGVMTLSMASCSDFSGMLSGMFGGETSVEEDNSPIILKEVTKAKNVILLIGDGMGPNQIKAGELFKDEPLTMQGFPYMTTVETRSFSDYITDSAAAATALAVSCVQTAITGIGSQPSSAHRAGESSP